MENETCDNESRFFGLYVFIAANFTNILQETFTPISICQKI